MRLDDLFQLALFGGQLVKVRIWIGVQRVHFIQTFQGADHFGHRLFDRFANGVFRGELRFLRQVANFDAWLWASFALNICIDASHNAQQGRLTGAVQTQYADFRPREEAQRDVFQNMTFRRNHFADTMHGINELSHVGLRLYRFIVMKNNFQRRSVAFFPG